MRARTNIGSKSKEDFAILQYFDSKKRYFGYLFFGFSVTRGTIISSIDMPPCWNVSR